MRILEPGKVNKTWTLQHRCTGWGNDHEGCNALLELEIEDLRYYPGFDTEFNNVLKEPEELDETPSVCFLCPCCKKLTDLGLNDWPQNYKNLNLWSFEWAQGY
jgi:hypothetical protein